MLDTNDLLPYLSQLMFANWRFTLENGKCLKPLERIRCRRLPTLPWKPWTPSWNLEIKCIRVCDWILSNMLPYYDPVRSNITLFANSNYTINYIWHDSLTVERSSLYSPCQSSSFPLNKTVVAWVGIKLLPLKQNEILEKQHTPKSFDSQ